MELYYKFNNNAPMPQLTPRESALIHRLIFGNSSPMGYEDRAKGEVFIEKEIRWLDDFGDYAKLLDRACARNPQLLKWHDHKYVYDTGMFKYQPQVKLTVRVVLMGYIVETDDYLESGNELLDLKYYVESWCPLLEEEYNVEPHTSWWRKLYEYLFE